MLSESFKEKMKQEAIERLKILEEKGQLENVRKEFEKNNTLYYTERTQLGGILYWVKNREELVKAVEEIEKEYDILVYFAIESRTEFGLVFDMLYVDKEQDTWEDDKQELKEGYAMSYCKNFTDDWCSEFGSIAIKCRNGGVIRIG